MSKYHFKETLLLTLTALLLSLGISGCGTVQDNLDKVRSLSPASVSERTETGPGTDVNASNAENSVNGISEVDNTPPVIDAGDLTVPYGTFLHLEDAASISDDRDPSPLLEIRAVYLLEQDEAAASVETEEKPTPEEPVSDEAHIGEAASLTENNPAAEAGVEEAVSEISSANAGISEVSSEPAEIETEAGPAGAADAASENQQGIGTAEEDTESEKDPATEEEKGPGYLFSIPGLYNMELLGTDVSGNQTQKSITVTVTDTVPPVLTGLQESFVITDQDTAPPSYLEGVSAADEIDGDLTASVTVDDSQVQYGIPGIYSILCSVSDASANETTASASVTIEDVTAPVITLSESSIGLFVTDSAPDYAAYVTADDASDGDVKDTLTIDDSAVKYAYPGTYSALISAQDRSGNTAQSSMEVVISGGLTTRDGMTFYYSTDDGHLYHGWSTIDGVKYYFDPGDGHLLTGLQTIDGKQYLLDSGDGRMMTLWQTIDDRKYYFSPEDGHMYHSWSNIEGAKYYFHPDDGHMLTGLQTIDGKQYLLATPGGRMMTGWQTISGRKYYFAADDGHMYHSWSTIDGRKYYFNPADGHLHTGLQTIGDKQYLLDSKDGHAVTGWQTIGGKTYYFADNDGHMYKSWSKIGNKKYYFDPNDGHMLTGWQDIGGRRYYLSPDDGHMYQSWSTIEGNKYYFSPDDGHMYKDWSKIGDKKYYFDPASGCMLTGWLPLNGRFYYLSPNDGHMYKSWSNIDGEKYYFSPDDGHMYIGWSNIGNKKYYFDPYDGILFTSWLYLDGYYYYLSPDDGHMYKGWSNIYGDTYYFDQDTGRMYTGTHTIGGEKYDFGIDGVATKVVTQQSSASTRSSSGDSGYYIGNRNTKVFHYPSCSSVSRMKSSNKVEFYSKSAAENANYRPCGICHP